MLDPTGAIDWFIPLVWLGVVAVTGFLVSWVLTDVGRIRRSAYVAFLAAVTGGVTAGYLLSSDGGPTFWTHNWPWGVLGAAVTAAFLMLQIRRAPPPSPAARQLNAGDGLWEGVVYGTAEGLLLSVLPVVATWQGFAALGWTDEWLGAGAGGAALAASALVIIVHHLGYREYRNRSVVRPLVACLALSVGYLLTASPISAIGGHIVLHLALLRRGMELPPHVAPTNAARWGADHEPALAG